MQGLKKTDRSDKPNSNWLFVDARPNVIEVEKGQRDLISEYDHRHHLVDDTRNQTLDEQRLENLIKTKKEKGSVLTPLSTSEVTG